MTHASTLLVGLVLLAACGSGDDLTAPMAVSTTGHAPLAAATTHNSQRDLVSDDVVVTNPCNGESVTLHIRQLFTLHEVSVDGKFFHGHLTFNDRGTRGVGLTTGATYRQVGAEQEFAHFTGEVGASRRIENTIDLISQGSVPNLVVHEIFRLIVSPSGTTRLEFDKVRTTCRG